MNYEKIYIRLLVLLNTLLYSFIAFFIFFILGLVNVDAQSLSWNNPTYISINNGYPGQNILRQVDGGSAVGNLGAFDINGRYSWAIYRVNTNNINNEYQKLDRGSYSVSFQAVVQLANSNTPVTIMVYDNGTQYTGTCDAGLTQEVTEHYVSSNYGNTKLYRVKYNCNRMNVNLDNVDHISIGFTNDLYSISYFAIESNLVMIDLNDTTADTDKIIANNNKNSQDIIASQNANADKIQNAINESNETNKSILSKISDFFDNFFDSLVGLIVPDNFDFLTGFIDTLENKLGFIASVPIQILEFLVDLVTYNIDDFTSITLPKFSVLGYDLWNDINIDLTSIINTFKPYRIYTNIACVSLASYYMMKLYENFASGGGD